MKRRRNPAQNQDEAWKGIIKALFPDFCRFFLPQLTQHVDFERGFHFLDKELSNLFPHAKKGGRNADLLIKVFLKNGVAQWVLIHIEIQSHKLYKEDFAKRMFQNVYRGLDHYKQNIVSFVVFADPHLGYHPNEYRYEFFGTNIQFSFEFYKIIDHSEDSLLQCDNPFALAVLAAQYAMKAKKADDQKKFFKLQLARLLYGRHYSKRQMVQLFQFLDIIMYINDQTIRHEFYAEMNQLEGGPEMLLMGNIEEIGYERGIEEGIKKGKEEGREEGILFGKIQALQEMLNDPIASTELLRGKPLEELQTLLQELKARLSR